MKLKYLCSSFSNSLAQQAVCEEGKYKVYGASGFLGYIDEYGSKTPYLGIVKDGAGVGRVQKYDGYTSLLGTLAYIIPNDGVNIDWLRYNISALELGKDVGLTTIPHIYFSDYGNREILYVDANKQDAIASYLDQRCSYINTIIDKTNKSIEDYKLLRQTVVTRAVTEGVRGKRKQKDSGIEWIGKIPEEWEIFRIAALYSERKENGNDELPILTVSINTGVSDRELSDEESERVFVRSEDRSKYMRVYPGDLTYNMMRAWQGAFGAVRVDGMVSPAYVIVKPRREIDSRYMEALLRTQPAKEEMKRYSHGIADFRLRLYWDKFRTIKVCFPPIEEQREIADYIDQKCVEIDALIAKKEQFLTELENYKRSMIYEYVTGKKEVPHS